MMSLDTNAIQTGGDLERWRLRIGFTQKDVADRLPVPLKTWQGWEQGRAIPPYLWRALRDIEQEARAAALPTEPKPRNRSHRSGETVQVHLGGPHPVGTVLHIAEVNVRGVPMFRACEGPFKGWRGDVFQEYYVGEGEAVSAGRPIPFDADDEWLQSFKIK